MARAWLPVSFPPNPEQIFHGMLATQGFQAQLTTAQLFPELINQDIPFKTSFLMEKSPEGVPETQNCLITPTLKGSLALGSSGVSGFSFVSSLSPCGTHCSCSLLSNLRARCGNQTHTNFHDSVSTSALSLFTADLWVLSAWETKSGFQGKRWIFLPKFG